MVDSTHESVTTVSFSAEPETEVFGEVSVESMEMFGPLISAIIFLPFGNDSFFVKDIDHFSGFG